MNRAHEATDSVADWATEHAHRYTAHRALPLCSGNCNQGRSDCQCPTGRQMPAEAATEIGADAGDEFANADHIFWIYTLCGLSVWALVITVWLAGS